MKKHNISITTSERKESNLINMQLQYIHESDMLSSEEVATQLHMISKRKEKLVREIYKKNHPRSDKFCITARGYIKSTNPNYFAKTEEELLEKLYNHYFGKTMEDEYKAWLLKRAQRVDKGTLSGKTLREDMGIWERVLSKEPIAHVPLDTVRAIDISNMFEQWASSEDLRKKEFSNRKSLLNGIYRQAVLDQIVPFNIIPSIECGQLQLLDEKDPQPYTIEERNKLLAYLKSLPEQNAYSLAIQLDFHVTMRIGEIKALKLGHTDENFIYIDKQLVEENEMIIEKDSVKVGKAVNIEKTPKGKVRFSKRTNELTTECARILLEASQLNPNGEFLFMHKGRPLTTDTFNRYLKKYTTAVNIPYRSSHQIRFSSASILSQVGHVSLENLRKLMGHSTTRMTEHYANNSISNVSNTGICEAVLG